MSTFGNSLKGWKAAITGFDALFLCTVIIAVQLSYFGNLIAGIGVMALFAQLRSVWAQRMSQPGFQKWRKVFNVNLTRNDYLLIAIALVVFQLIFTGHAIAADPVSPDAGKGAATGLNKAWETLFKGDGTPSFFGVLCNTLRGIGIIALVLQGGMALIKLVSADGNPSAKEFVRIQVIERIIPNAIVIMLLANNGAGGANLVLTARSFIFSWDKVAYTAMKDTAEKLNQQQIIGEERKALEELRGLFNTCISIPPKIGGENNPVFTQCIGEFQTKNIEVAASGRIKNEATKVQLAKLFDELVKASEGNIDDSLSRGLIHIGAGLSSLIGSSVKNELDEFVNVIVMSFGIAYNICIELALMLMGVSLPLVLMLSLYKFDVLLRWLPQLLNLFTAKITYTIVGGLVQYLKADAGADLGVWGLAILMGFGAPLVSIFTSLALSGSMASVFEREAVRGAAAGARMAAGGVAAGAGLVGGTARSAGGVIGAGVAKAAEVIAKRV
jgi:hypothetical protein